MMMRLLALFCLALSFTFTASVSAQVDERPEIVRVGVFEGAPPYISRNDQGHLEGIVIDLWRAWGAHHNITVEFHASDIGGSVLSTALGEVDVHMGMFGEYIPIEGLTKAKPYYGFSVALYHPPGLAIDLPFLRVAVTKEMSYSPEYTRFIDRSYAVEIIQESDEEALQAVLRGDADAAMVSSKQFADAYIAESGAAGQLISETSFNGFSLLYPQLPADNLSLRELVDDGFDALPRSILEEIEERWLGDSNNRYFGFSRDGLLLSDSERELIANTGTIPVIFARDDFAPFYFDNNGTLSGIDIDVLGLLSERLGLRFEPRFVDDWSSSLSTIRDGELTLVTSVINSPERAEYMIFSEPYYESKNAVVTRLDVNLTRLEDLRFKIVAIPRSWRIGEVLREVDPTVRILETRDVSEALKMVANGTAYAFVGNRVNASYEIDRGDYTNLKIALPIELGQAPLRIGASPTQQPLIEIINKGLETITEQELSTIKNRWYRVQYDDRDQLVRVYRNLGVVGLILAGVFVGIFMWSQRLKREVQARQVVEKKLIAAREAAEAAADAKSSFLATMSHEIRTPLNGVLGMLEVLSKTQLNQEQREQIDTIQTSGNNLLEIINDVLDFSKIDAGKLSLEVLPTNLHDLLEHVHELMSATASKKGLKVSYISSADEGSFYLIDPTRVRQVVMNLVSNAVKFTHEGGVDIQLEINTSRPRHKICISVIDTGVGIDEEQIASLFTPFEQAESSTSRRFGGTGLGLSISKRIANLMGGELELKAHEPKGTRADFCFDAIPCDPVETLAQPSSEALPTLRPAHILLVEDHPTNQRVTMAQLKSLGLTADVAENGEVGLEMIENNQYALILSDCHMPVMDGYEMVSKLRAMEKTFGEAERVVVATTANALSEERQRCLDVGFTDYLAKPFSTDELHEVLAQYLSHKADESLLQPDSAESSELGCDFAPLQQMISDMSALQEVILEFLESSHSDIAAMLEAEINEDMPMLQQAAHRIKGTAPMVGAIALGSVARDVDDLAKLEDWEAWAKIKPEFMTTWFHFVEAAVHTFELDTSHLSALKHFD